MISDYTEVPLADVNRFIDDPKLLAPPESTNWGVIAEVMHIWSTDQDYLGPYGLPLELDLEESPGKNLSVLIFRADPTANPQAVLRDMVDWGVVKPVGARHYRVTARSMLFADVLTPHALEYFGRTLSSNKVHWTEPAKLVPTGLTVFHHVTEPVETTPLSQLLDRDSKDRPKAWTSRPEKGQLSEQLPD